MYEKHKCLPWGKIQKGCIFTMNYPMLNWRPVPVDQKSNMDNFTLLSTSIATCSMVTINQSQKILSRQHLVWRSCSSLTPKFDHMTWKSIGYIYSLGATIIPNLVSIEVLNIEQTTFFQRPAVWPWPLTMWKSIGVMTSTVLSLITFKHRDQNILSGHRLVYRPNDQPTDSCKKICRYFQRRHKFSS